MESLGAKLKETRERKGVTIEQVSRETNISKSYLQALEDEQFEVFPGEPYLLGFLRNYSDYLGLDPKEQVNHFRNARIQEQPVPMEELLNKRGSFPSFIPLGLIGAAVLAAGIYFAAPMVSNALNASVSIPVVDKSASEEILPEDTPVANEASEGTESKTYLFEGEALEERLFIGDSYSIKENDNTHRIVVKEIGTTVILTGFDKDFTLMLAQKMDLSIGEQNYSLSLVDIDNSPGKRSVVLGFGLSAGAESIGEAESPLQNPLLNSASASSEALPEAGETLVSSRKQDKLVLLSKDDRDSFAIDIVFRDNCNLRYLKDGDEREERFFEKGDKLRIDPYRYLMIWASNGGAINAKVQGVRIPFGRPGEVIAKQIRWSSKTDEGKYNLELIPVY